MPGTYSNITITNSATLILAANSRRQGFRITNNSVTQDAFIGFDSSVTSSNGLPLYANQTREEQRNGGSRCWLGDIYGIVAANTADIRFWEVTQ